MTAGQGGAMLATIRKHALRLQQSIQRAVLEVGLADSESAESGLSQSRVGCN